MGSISMGAMRTRNGTELCEVQWCAEAGNLSAFCQPVRTSKQASNPNVRAGAKGHEKAGIQMESWSGTYSSFSYLRPQKEVCWGKKYEGCARMQQHITQ